MDGWVSTFLPSKNLYLLLAELNLICDLKNLQNDFPQTEHLWCNFGERNGVEGRNYLPLFLLGLGFWRLSLPP